MYNPSLHYMHTYKFGFFLMYTHTLPLYYFKVYMQPLKYGRIEIMALGMHPVTMVVSWDIMIVN